MYYIYRANNSLLNGAIFFNHFPITVKCVLKFVLFFKTHLLYCCALYIYIHDFTYLGVQLLFIRQMFVVENNYTFFFSLAELSSLSIKNFHAFIFI